ncbi:Transcriptional regulatory protein moc3 [Fusarium oxysporum f. sp. cubense race 1]|uniref:Transcriptional regulatory protein moc3 n=1 Tax=Fusarium oxysporum f. sp. cubense (strain race 1) TaxID=1229664 RepID=N4UIK9_FUSC1|nr:Transcriptional regulatory protein moc3 [Fusarium oxysporum f. sp. cubense race 1]
MVDIPSKASTAGASRLRRAYHPKVKTGCQTCRIRRVKCDEGKPVCVRCTSTGRTCDGYTLPPSSSYSSSTSTSPSPQSSDSYNATADLKLILPRQSPEEVRSYRFFLEVTAPSLAGAFYADFWLAEVPRVCMSDAAIWHAVISLEALGHGGITESPALLLRNKTLNTWRYYTAPRPSHRPTPDTINQAYCAAESLFSGLILFSQEHAKQLGDLQTGKSGPAGLSMLAARQEAHTRCYKEISKAMDIFQQEVNATQWEPHAMLPLHLFKSVNRLLLIQDPEEHDLVKRQNDLPALYQSIVDLAEQIMNLDPVKTRRVSYTQHLFLVAHSGIGQSTRRRAVTLLRRPRLEGGWDSLISASLAEAIMDREREAACEYRLEQGLDAGTDGGEGKEGQKEEEEVDPMFRIFNITFAFTGQREARAVLRTWREKLDDVAGRSRVIRW